jgi:PAS domain S-box-containing protein
MSLTPRSSGGPEPADAPPAVLRVIADHLSAMLAYWDADQRCLFANRAYEKWFGVDPQSIVGKAMRELLGPLYALNLPYIEGALRGEPQEFERDIPDPAGGPPRHSLAQYIPDIDNGKVRGFCVLVTDVTRLRKAEQAVLDMEHQVQASERLASLATLAAGIAHEINNPLASVLAYAELALETVAAPAPNLEELKIDLVGARDAALRVRDIIQSMRLLARGDAMQRETVDVNETLQRSLDMVSASWRYRATVVRELESGVRVEANASQLMQVFVNLLANAAQALPEASAETNQIRIATRREGEMVIIEVSDNGCGIPEELQQRVFEPFFTTKGAGVGTGLGLSISSAIVTGLGGALSVKSTVRQGSTFRVSLPAKALDTAPGDRSASPLSQSPMVGGVGSVGRPRVLVIDDELAVARTLERIFSKDCDVVVTNHGREAISLLLDDEQPSFDMILCDLMMPEPSGDAVYAEVAQRRPELTSRFVFMTGGAFTPRGRHFLNSVPVEVIEKPFDLKHLRSLVAARSAKR